MDGPSRADDLTVLRARRPWRWPAALLLLAALLLPALAAAPPARAATFTVTNRNDSGPGSLRQAIAEAAAGDTITFAVTGTIGLTSGELVIDKDLTISGPGAALLTVSGNNASGVFRIEEGVIAAIAGVTITGGRTPIGGGVYTSGTLTLISSTLSGNAAEAGGGVFTSGTLTLISSTLSGNDADQGGGVFNDGTLTLTNSTLSGNDADQGGGVYNAGTLTLTNSTLSGNGSVVGVGGGVYNEGTATLTGTILANGAGDNCVALGPINSTGHNLATDASCNLTTPTDQQDTDPLLGPLAANGGPTLTHLPQPGSPAIDRIPPAACAVATDQRGVPRPQGPACDIGAVEVRPAAAALSPASLAFGAQQVGTTSAPQPVTLTNAGELPLTITGITANGDFARTTTCPASLVPGTSCTISVTFTPTAVGGRTGALTVASNAAGSPHTVALSGSGTPAPPPPAATYTLSLTSTPGGSATGGGSYSPGSVATLAASPEAGFVFTGWTLDGRFVGWANPLTLTMNSDHTAVATFAAPPDFPDVPTGAPYDEAIRQLAARGVIRGYQDGRFGPDDTTLRAQMAALIARALGWDAEDHGTTFPDRGEVDANLWRNVGTLAFYDVARGYPDGTFQPTAPVLNAQVVSFVTRAMVARGYWTPQPDDGGLYPNVPADSGHRADLATYVAYAGAVPGAGASDEGWAGWDAPSTRGWHAEVLWRALDSYWGVDRVE